MSKLSTYANFQSKADQVKNDLLSWLIQEKREGRRVAAYGAAAKGNTLLNYAGIKPDLLPYVCDAAPAKQSKYLPGSHIPIVSPDTLRSEPPDLLLVLPWNLGKEVHQQLFDLEEKGVEFVTALPQLTMLNL